MNGELKKGDKKMELKTPKLKIINMVINAKIPFQRSLKFEEINNLKN